MQNKYLIIFEVVKGWNLFMGSVRTYKINGRLSKYEAEIIRRVKAGHSDINHYRQVGFDFAKRYVKTNKKLKMLAMPVYRPDKLRFEHIAGSLEKEEFMNQVLEYMKK